MKVSDVLAGVSKIYFDAAPLVYYLKAALKQFAAIAGDLGLGAVE